MLLQLEDAFPRLVSAYGRGRLVPFIGSGLSWPMCPNWTDFIGGLERAQGLLVSDGSSDPHALIRRANSAVRKLKLSTPSMRDFAQHVLHALTTQRKDPPAQTISLAKLAWPLVLTTNYDNGFATAYRAHEDRELDVLGREAPDCQRVLNALTNPASSILWALQGYLPGPCDARYADPHLADQLVVGHDEYRKVTHREPHFRRAFAEVFHNRSLLYVGSGFADPYLLELFGEILETYGPCAHPHYALMKRGTATDTAFLLSRFQTIVLEYDEHEELPGILDDFAARVEHAASREVRLTYSLTVPARQRDCPPCMDFEVEHSPLPGSGVGPKECIALSAGGEGKDDSAKFFFSPEIEEYLEREHAIERGTNPELLSALLGRFANKPLYAVRARLTNDRRDVRVIRDACIALFDRAWADGFKRVRLQLLATGKGRVFPSRSSFVQIVRAFARWRRDHPQSELALTLHLPTRAVFDEIASGRIDVVELLACEDIRFWSEVVTRDRSVERRLFQWTEHVHVSSVRAALDLPQKGWVVEVLPPPSREASKKPVEEVDEKTLFELGVVPGCTLRFTPEGGWRVRPGAVSEHDERAMATVLDVIEARIARP